MENSIAETKNMLKNEYINAWIGQAICLENLFNSKNNRVQIINDIHEKDELINHIREKLIRLSEKC